MSLNCPLKAYLCCELVLLKENLLWDLCRCTRQIVGNKNNLSSYSGASPVFSATGNVTSYLYNLYIFICIYLSFIIYKFMIYIFIIYIFILSNWHGDVIKPMVSKKVEHQDNHFTHKEWNSFYSRSREWINVKEERHICMERWEKWNDIRLWERNSDANGDNDEKC